MYNVYACVHHTVRPRRGVSLSAKRQDSLIFYLSSFFALQFHLIACSHLMAPQKVENDNRQSGMDASEKWQQQEFANEIFRKVVLAIRKRYGRSSVIV